MSKHIAYFAVVLSLAVASGLVSGVIALLTVLGMGFAFWALMAAIVELE